MENSVKGTSSSIAKGRDSFPKGFLWGTASSSFQYEGAVKEGDRRDSMWDHFSRTYPHRTSNSHANEAVDFYHRYKEDIKRMKEINMDSFRLSISWARVIPYGRRSRGVSSEGIKFYNDLIDELLANGLTPLVTLFHWDIPQELEDEYGGFLSEQIVDDFRDYASLCFEIFGDRVKYWITHNEPWVYSVAGYDTGRKAPGRCSKYVNPLSVAGMSGYEAYIVTHNMLNAHAEAVEVFRQNEKCKDGLIGIAHNPLWYEPYDEDDPEDVEGCQRAMDFMFGWHQHPTAVGDYPEVMKKLIGNRLPSFTAKQSEKLKNSYDFVGINYYSSLYAKAMPDADPTKPTWRTDQHVEWMKENKRGEQLGAAGGMEWNFDYPQGLRKVLKYVKDKYNNPKIIITENGYGETYNPSMTMYNPSIDTERVTYHEGHIQAIHQAIYEDGVQVIGYFAWSLLDNFEWNVGYGARFGLYYIDYKDGLKRYPKMSAIWFREFLKKKEETGNEHKKGSFGHNLLHSITDSSIFHSITDHNWKGHGNVPAVLGSLFVVSATVGTTLFFKSSNN